MHRCLGLIYYYYYYLIFASFSHKHQLMVFHWSLGDIKSPQISGNLLNILADLNNDVVRIVLFFSNTPIPLSKPLGTVLNAAITIGIIVTLFVHFFLVLWLYRSICFFFAFFDFNIVVTGTVKFSFFLSFITNSGFLSWI